MSSENLLFGNYLDIDLSSSALQYGFNSSAGQSFKKYITSTTGFDESIFTKSTAELKNMDLSSDAVEKNANDENAFYQILNQIYSNSTIKNYIDKDSDGVISDDEAKEIIEEIKNNDANADDLSLNDVAALVDDLQETQSQSKFDKILENIKKSFDKVVDEALAQIQNLRNQKESSSSSSSSSNSSTTKSDLESKIEEQNNKISDIYLEKDDSLTQAVEERESNKETLTTAISSDDNLSDITKTDFIDLLNEIEEVEKQIADYDSQIAKVQSDLTIGENKLQSLQDALANLTKPEDANQSTLEKYEERKSELEEQIEKQEEANEKLKEQLEGTDGLLDKKEKLEEKLNEPDTGLYDRYDKIKTLIKSIASKDTTSAIFNYTNSKKAVEELKTEELNNAKNELKNSQDELKTLEDEEQESANKKVASTFDADFDEMLGQVFGYEGGFGNHPNDAGGATNYGITETTYREYTQNPNADVRNITKDEAAQIYYEMFYQGVGAEEYAEAGNKEYAFALFDAAVNHGIGAAKQMDAQANGDVDKFMEIRKQKYINIVANDSSQAVFDLGWQNRWNKVYSFIDPTHEYEDYIGYYS